MNFGFVAARWQSPFWRTWDWMLLVLALIHGINGLRIITLDYVRRPGIRFDDQHGLLRRRVHAVRPRHRRSCSRSTRRSGREPREPMTTTHTYDAVIVGAGGAGLRAAIETSGPGPHRRHLQALPHALPHGRRAGRRVRGAREHGGGLPRVARVRHGEGRRLPGRPARRRAAVRARPSTRSTSSSTGACRSTARRTARSRSGGSAGTRATTARDR